MLTTYRLQARPVIRPKGEFKQQLLYVELHAQSEIDEFQWSIEDPCELYAFLVNLCTEADAVQLMERLRNGETIELPEPLTTEKLTSLEENEATLGGETSFG